MNTVRLPSSIGTAVLLAMLAKVAGGDENMGCECPKCTAERAAHAARASQESGEATPTPPPNGTIPGDILGGFDVALQMMRKGRNVRRPTYVDAVSVSMDLGSFWIGPDSSGNLAPWNPSLEDLAATDWEIGGPHPDKPIRLFGVDAGRPLPSGKQETWRDRATVEKHELNERISRLSLYLNGMPDVSGHQRDLLYSQLGAMRLYGSILSRRISAP